MNKQPNAHIAEYPTNATSEEYCKGYILGYSVGYRACAADIASGNYSEQADDIRFLPLEALQLSSRSRNSLQRAGCSTVANTIALSETDIARMRGLGKIGANEIALRLRSLGICNTSWDRFIL